MRLFVGLGNPGAKHARNRHNIGFMAIDEIAREHGFPGFRGKFRGTISDGRLGDVRVVLLKPATYMNLSGDSVAEAVRFFRLDPADVVVFHDEIDLAPGRLKVKRGGGHAGHNGLRSIQAHLGPDFVRVRMGVGHPGHRDAVSHYVLHDFARADEGWLGDMLRGVAEGAPDLAAGDQGRFMNAVARRLSPPRPSTGRKPARPGAAPAPGPKPQGASGPATGEATGAATDTATGEATAAAGGAPPRTRPAPDSASEPETDTRTPLQRLVDRFR